jgi:carbon monoxide dehydrogenase subunit G
MKLNFSGNETIDVAPQSLWDAVIDPEILQKVVPGCREMRAVDEAEYIIELDLRVAAVGGSFEGKITLSDMHPPARCQITVSGEGTLGTGTGTASVMIAAESEGRSTISYEADGDVGGLVAGVGQRVLMGVAKHLTRQFFTSLKKHFTNPSTA